MYLIFKTSDGKKVHRIVNVTDISVIKLPGFSSWDSSKEQEYIWQLVDTQADVSHFSPHMISSYAKEEDAYNMLALIYDAIKNNKSYCEVQYDYEIF